MKKQLLLLLPLLLTGCAQQPLRKFHEFIFDVPYVQQEQKCDDLKLGYRLLPSAEVDEVFRKSGELNRKFFVNYVRLTNTGSASYVMQTLNENVAQWGEVKEYFHVPERSSWWWRVGIPALPILLCFTIDDGPTMGAMLGFFAIPISLLLLAGTSFASMVYDTYRESKNTGHGGYQNVLNDYVVAREHTIDGRQDCGVRALNIPPYSTRHALIFTDPSTENRLRLAVSRVGMTTQEITFDPNTDR
jgi:hypothetical protein